MGKLLVEKRNNLQNNNKTFSPVIMLKQLSKLFPHHLGFGIQISGFRSIIKYVRLGMQHDWDGFYVAILMQFMSTTITDPDICVARSVSMLMR